MEGRRVGEDELGKWLLEVAKKAKRGLRLLSSQIESSRTWRAAKESGGRK